jgi:peptide/nickel transport system ATP-binding protein
MWFRRRKRRSLDSADRFPSAPPDAPLLEVDDARTYFETDRGPVRAVDGVTFSLDRGKTLGIVGESGCGKTVLSRSVMGLLPKHNVIRSGSVKFEGQEIGNWGPDQMRPLWGTQMAMVFQDPMTSLNPVMSIGHQITEPLLYHFDIATGYARELAVALLQSVGIPEPERRLKQFPHELSGGMRQRVMIAIAMACGPKLLFADEPTTALDVTVQAQILDLLQAQQRERYMAMTLVTHDLGVVAGRTDDIAVMYAGKLVEKAPTKVLFSQPRMPYTEALMASIPKLGDASHSRLATIPGRPPNLMHPPTGCKFSPRCAYVQDKCRVEEPPLRPGPDAKHEFACWFPVGTPEGRAAFDSNKNAGLAAVEARLGETVAADRVT